MNKNIYIIKQNGIINKDCYTSLKDACKELEVSYSTAKQTSKNEDLVVFFAAKNGVTKEIYKLNLIKIKGRGIRSTNIFEKK